MEYGCTPHYLRLCLGIRMEQARETSINFVVFRHSSRLHWCPLFVSRSFRHLCVYWKWKMVNALSDFTYRYVDIPRSHDCTVLMCCVMYYLNKYQCVTVSYHLYIKTGLCGYCRDRLLMYKVNVRNYVRTFYGRLWYLHCVEGTVLRQAVDVCVQGYEFCTSTLWLYQFNSTALVVERIYYKLYVINESLISLAMDGQISICFVSIVVAIYLYWFFSFMSMYLRQ